MSPGVTFGADQDESTNWLTVWVTPDNH